MIETLHAPTAINGDFISGDLLTALDPSRVMNALGITPDPWQAELLRSTAHQHLLLCTRQAGKSTTAAALAVWESIYSGPALILLLSPSLRQSQELFKKVLDFYHALPHRVPIKDASQLRMELVNGSRIIALPGREETIRGYSGVRLLLVDEAAQVPDALYYSVRPMLAVSAGRLVVMSTPYGKRGFFHEVWENGGADWHKVKVTALDCPRISAEHLERERRDMPARAFEQEYLCEFKDTIDQVFSYDVVMNAVNPELRAYTLEDLLQ